MKTKLFTSTLLLFIISLIAKLLSFSIKIQLAKTMNNQAMELYTLSSSTMIFLITFVQAGLPSTINTLIAKKNNSIAILQNSIFISFITNTTAIFIYLIAIPYMTQNILHHAQTPVLLAIIPLLPLVTISGICKGYCLGKQKIILANSSNITEEVFRIIFLIICFPYVKHSPTLFATIAILSIAIGEIGAILHILLFIKVNKIIKNIFIKTYITYANIKEILSYAIYMSASRFVGSLAHFIEPLLFSIPTNIILQSQLVTTFTHIHACVLPIITLPSFFTFTLSSWLLSSLSHHLANRNMKQAKKILYYVLSISALIGIFGSIVCYFFFNEISYLFYKNTQSALLLKQLSLPFIIFSLQTPLSTALHAYNKSKLALYDTIIGNIVKLSIITLLPKYVGAQALVIAIVLGMLITTFLHLYHVQKLFFNNP